MPVFSWFLVKPSNLIQYIINAPVHVPIVFDNLIHRGEMPVTVGLFVNPGDVPRDGQRNRQASNRSFEYDTLSDQYVRFLLEEDDVIDVTQDGRGPS